MSTTAHAACIPPPLEHADQDQELACRSLSSMSLFTMVGNEFTNEECTDPNKDEATECSMRMPSPVTVCIPKVEPCYNSLSDDNEDLLDTDELVGSTIPFITPYKIKDPVIVLEKCDKIWETLKLIKDVQGTKSTNALDSVSLEDDTNHTPYIKYQPNLLGNNNVTMPNLKLCVKSTKKLYPCATCAKVYLHKRDLRHHAAKIHGILIALDRPKSNVSGKHSVSKDKESPVAETEQSNVKKLDVKRSHSKQIKDLSPKSAKSNTNESNPESISSSHSHGKKTNISVHTKDTLINGENVQKDQKKEKEKSPKESNQNSTPALLDQPSSSYKQCVLCKYFVKDLRKHLVDYHKIQATDFMLKELGKSTAVLKVNKSKNNIGNNNNNSLKSDAVGNGKQQFQRHEKRKLNVSHTGHEKRFKINNSPELQNGNYQCDICSGIYKPHNVKRHLQGHRNRGETKENFHLINYDYLDPSDINGFKDSNKRISANLFKNKRNQRMSRKRKEFYRLNDGKGNTTCSCGRSFRNPYTLFVHKTNCKLQNDEMDEYAMENDKETVANSTTGINITIKKRNDSYEIVSKEAENGKESQDLATGTDPLEEPHEKDTEKHEQEDNEVTGSSKYSDEHKFLKLQIIDEDVDVDIEENSQSGAVISNSNTDNLLTNELINESEQQDNEPITRRSRSSGRSASTVKSASKNLLESHIIEKKNICVCGTLFDTRKALDVHILKHQTHKRLMCGYCNTSFPDIDLWKKHQCVVTKNTLFIDIPLEIDCHICDITLSSYVAFDDHVRKTHYDSVVPYLCFQCNKRFCNATVRKNHINSEHDKYICPMCDMTYTDKMRSRHEGYHYGLGYPCHLCKKTYSAKSYYARHVQKTHPTRRSQNKVACDPHLAS